ncbi:hypothetical protein QVZ41_05685 [Wenyingzhuangia sp. chi5]|uniref:T9SS C-terminal target domain-containing protein n=1 Tax=Wenyingzhuangia gilva TaxID=3057677 RepID=A0ABT8VQU3_9FLAO|nr:hypothetical protein [Wenyingzhuangia sp. chi5]MDO3694336.1 hypothetical protein [Wenyingzhuangia sp. chi5]
MKKITLLIAVLFITTYINAQSSQYNIDENKVENVQENPKSNNAKIPGAKVSVVNGGVKVEGASLLAIYNVVGQEVKNRDLASGVYIVRIFKDDIIALVKIAI